MIRQISAAYRLGVAIGCVLALIAPSGAGATAAEAEAVPSAMTVDAAIRWALEHNPELMSFRQQHGVAAAAVVIAQTYPFNPVWEGKIRAANGPESAGISNRVSNEHKVFVDVEVRGQRRIREQAAAAGLSRTDWEIAYQELALSVRVARAFDTVLYRYKKWELAKQTADLNTKAAAQAEDLWKQNQFKTADLIALRTEAAASRTQVATARLSLQAAWADLKRAMGLVNEQPTVQGDLIVPPPAEDAATLEQGALERRPDLRARQAALSEANARLRLEIANRWGNPNLGPAYEYDPARINLIGVQFTLPLPVFNTHRGDIMQREAECIRASLDIQQTSVLVRQDVANALARLEQARAGVDTYHKDVVPVLETALKEMKALFERPDQGVDQLKVLDVQRKLLSARDGELDALWELRQAQADLAAAVADPAVAVSVTPAR